MRCRTTAKPVHCQRDDKTLRPLPHRLQRAEIHRDHHRIDHRPDQDGDGEIDRGILELGERAEEPRREVAEQEPGQDAERHPEGQPTFEQARESSFSSGTQNAAAKGGVSMPMNSASGPAAPGDRGRVPASLRPSPPPAGRRFHSGEAGLAPVSPAAETQAPRRARVSQPALRRSSRARRGRRRGGQGPQARRCARQEPGCSSARACPSPVRRCR